MTYLDIACQRMRAGVQVVWRDGCYMVIRPQTPELRPWADTAFIALDPREAAYVYNRWVDCILPRPEITREQVLQSLHMYMPVDPRLDDTVTTNPLDIPDSHGYKTWNP